MANDKEDQFALDTADEKILAPEVRMGNINSSENKITNIVSQGEEVVALLYDQPTNSNSNDNSIVVEHNAKASSPLMDASR